MTATADGWAAELISDRDELDGLADEWRRFAVERANAFVSPEWMFASLATIDRDAQPAVPVVRDADGALRGLLPLVAGRGNALRFAGARPADRLHPAAPSADEDRVAAAAAAAIAGRHRVLRLDCVDTASGWAQALASAARPRLRIAAQPPEELPYIPLDGQSFDEFMATRSRGLRSQVGRRTRGLRKEHEVRLEVLRDRDGVEAGLGELFRLHDLRTETSGRLSSFDDPRVRAFHARFVDAALARGWLRLCLLEVDGAAIAAWYGWSIGGRYAYYQAGFDPAWSRSSPGLLLLAETVRLAAEEGASEYDLLRGDEPFKRRFAERARTATSLVLAPRMHPALVRAMVAARLRTLWRRLPDGARARLGRLRGDRV